MEEQENKLISFELKGLIPSKKNSKIMVCRGRYPMLLPSKKYTEWHKEALKQLEAQNVPKAKLKKTITIYVYFLIDNKRKFDLSNKFESIADLLVDYGLLEDDNYEVLPIVILKFQARSAKGTMGANVRIMY